MFLKQTCLKTKEVLEVKVAKLLEVMIKYKSVVKMSKKVVMNLGITNKAIPEGRPLQ